MTHTVLPGGVIRVILYCGYVRRSNQATTSLLEFEHGGQSPPRLKSHHREYNSVIRQEIQRTFASPPSVMVALDRPALPIP